MYFTIRRGLPAPLARSHLSMMVAELPDNEGVGTKVFFAAPGSRINAIGFEHQFIATRFRALLTQYRGSGPGAIEFECSTTPPPGVCFVEAVIGTLEGEIAIAFDPITAMHMTAFLSKFFE